MRSSIVIVLCILLFTGCSSLLIHDDDNIAVVATKVTVRAANCALTIFGGCLSEWWFMHDAYVESFVWYGQGDINGDNYKCQQEASSSSSGATGFIHMPVGKNIISLPMDSGGGTQINQQLYHSCMRARGYTLVDGYELKRWREKQANNSGADGSKYVGGIKDNKFHGQGTYTAPNGDKYVGEFKDNKFHGQGTYAYANGGKYVGEWKDNKFHGQGTFTYGSGDKYVGEWKDNKFHGQGTYAYADGRKVVGEWKDNVWQK